MSTFRYRAENGEINIACNIFSAVTGSITNGTYGTLTGNTITANTINSTVVRSEMTNLFAGYNLYNQYKYCYHICRKYYNCHNRNS